MEKESIKNSKLLHDNPLSSGYKVDMNKLHLEHTKAKKEQKQYLRNRKLFKHMNRLFWFSLFSFTMWLGSGFYDLFPRLRLNERIDEYRERKRLRHEVDNLNNNKK